MEVLTLPEPGRTLFLKAQPVLIRGCGLAEQGKPPRSVFGGGTILAARWHHRESKDVDIRARLQGDNGVVSRLRQIPTMEQTWNQWLQEAGMTPLKWHSAYKVTAQLRGREGESEPKLEIGEFEAPLEEEATRAKVEEQHVRVASNASILAGKWWGRRTHAPVRDLYDIVVAGAKDPGALQRALQTGGKGGAIDEFLKNMIENREQYMRGRPRRRRTEWNDRRIRKGSAQPCMVGGMDGGALGHDRTHSGRDGRRLENDYAVCSDTGTSTLVDGQNNRGSSTLRTMGGATKQRRA